MELHVIQQAGPVGSGRTGLIGAAAKSGARTRAEDRYARLRAGAKHVIDVDLEPRTSLLNQNKVPLAVGQFARRPERERWLVAAINEHAEGGVVVANQIQCTDARHDCERRHCLLARRLQPKPDCIVVLGFIKALQHFVVGAGPVERKGDVCSAESVDGGHHIVQNTIPSMPGVVSCVAVEWVIADVVSVDRRPELLPCIHQVRHLARRKCLVVELYLVKITSPGRSTNVQAGESAQRRGQRHLGAQSAVDEDLDQRASALDHHMVPGTVGHFDCIASHGQGLTCSVAAHQQSLDWIELDGHSSASIGPQKGQYRHRLIDRVPLPVADSKVGRVKGGQARDLGDRRLSIEAVAQRAEVESVGCWQDVRQKCFQRTDLWIGSNQFIVHPDNQRLAQGGLGRFGT